MQPGQARVEIFEKLLGLQANHRLERMQAMKLRKWQSKLRPSIALDHGQHGFGSAARTV